MPFRFRHRGLGQNNCVFEIYGRPLILKTAILAVEGQDAGFKIESLRFTGGTCRLWVSALGYRVLCLGFLRG